MKVGLKMLLGFLILLLVLSEAVPVCFLVAISKDKLVTKVALEFQQFDMPAVEDRIAYEAPSSKKVKDGLATKDKRINWRWRDLAPGELVVWTGQRVRPEPKRQPGREEF